MKLHNIFFSYSVPDLLHKKTRVLLALFGVVLATAIYISIQIANQAVINDYETTLNTLVGDRGVSVVARSGLIPAPFLEDLVRKDPQLEIQPIATKEIQMYEGDESYTVILVGLDLLAKTLTSFSENSEDKQIDLDLFKQKKVLITPKLNELLSGNKVQIKTDDGQTLFLGVQLSESVARIRGDMTVLCDLSLFETISGSGFGFDELVLYPPKGGDTDSYRKTIADSLPDSLIVADKDMRVSRIASSSEALRVNLVFLSALSLLVAVLINFQVINLLIESRTRDLQVLLSLGFSPRRIRSLILIEAVAIGLLGGLLGTALGNFLGLYTTEAVRATVSSFYEQLSFHSFIPSVSLHILGVSIGIGGAFLGALLPAQTLSTLAPAQFFHRLKRSDNSLRENLLLASLGMLVGISLLLLQQVSFFAHSTIEPFLYPSALCIIAISLSPILLHFALLAFRRLSVLSPLVVTGTSALLARSRDHGLMIGAVAVTLGMYIGVSVMIDSFRYTFIDWLEAILRADLYISDEDRDLKRSSDLVAYLKKDARVDMVGHGAETSYQYGERKIFIRWIDLSVAREKKALVPQAPQIIDWQGIESGKAAIISESLSRKENLSIGDELRFAFLKGDLVIKVGAIAQDFSSDLGAVTITRSLYEKYLEGGRSLGVSVYLKDRSSQEAIAKRVRGDGWFIRDGNGLRLEALRIFDKTFSITYVLQILTLVLSLVFFANSAFLIQADLKQDLFILRSIGAQKRSIFLVFLAQTALLITLACLISLVLGLLLAATLVYSVNTEFFGWLVRFAVPYVSLIILFFSIAISTVIFSWLIVSQLRDETLTQELRYE